MVGYGNSVDCWFTMAYIIQYKIIQSLLKYEPCTVKKLDRFN